MVMVIHSLPLKSSGKWKGWWSWSYTASFLKALLLLGGKEGVMVKVIHSLLLKSSPPPGKGSGDDHGHTQPSSGKLSSSSGKWKTWWSWPYTAFLWKDLPLFWKMEGMVVMVIHSLPLESSPPLLDRSSPLYSGKVVVCWAGSEP